MRITRFSSAALAAATTLVCVPVTAHADEPITLTFVRHAQSAGNASGLIDTSVPGPGITDRGYREAVQAANELSTNGYDGIYASTMVRTQETAGPLADALDEPIEVLPGLREIEAGDFEGKPESSAAQYLAAPMAWLDGDRGARIPGSLNGDEFDARFDDAVETIYDSGDDNPVAFSHSAAIIFWVLMNVDNPDKSLVDGWLPNTGHVVVVGSPRQGWTLTDWNGAPIPR